jgi:hypothetical protein
MGHRLDESARRWPQVHGAAWETAREHGTVVRGAGRGLWAVGWAADGEVRHQPPIRHAGLALTL